MLNRGSSSYFKLGQKIFPHNKKGQVTIFIIVGILMLFAFAAILYFTRSTPTGQLLAQEEPFIASVPTKFEPIQTYTENCLELVGKKGLLILGQQGGYIYPELVGKYSATNPTEAEGIDLEPAKVPYWYYNSQKNGANIVTYSSLQPKLYYKEDEEMSIEAQLGRYVKEKVYICLDNYSAFQSEGFEVKIAEDSEVTSTAKVGDTGVAFLFTQKITAIQGTEQQEMEQFYVKVPLDLKHYYEVASLVAQAEQNYSFLEHQGMELLSVYSKVDFNYFPPISDVKYEAFSVYSWSESALKDKLKGVLTSYVPLLRYLGSSNFYRATFPEGNLLAQKVADNMVLTLYGANDLEMSFDYFGWEPYFKTNSEDGTIKPESISLNAFSGIVNFNQQRYETHYDFSYPVLVTMQDKNAFDGEGYTFLFALESNVRNNAPAIPNQEKEVYAKKISSLSCNEEQRNTELLKTVVVDSFTKEPLEMVKLGFSIPEVEDCNMGLTDKKGEFESKYPAVYGGVISFMKPEYLTDYYPIDTYKYKSDKDNKSNKAIIGYAVEGAAQSKAVELQRIKNINITIKKKELKECITPLTCQYTTGAVLIVPYNDIECKKAAEQCFFNQGQNLLGKNEPVYNLEINSSKSKYHDYYLIDQEKKLAASEEAIITLERVSGLNKAMRSDPFSATISISGGQLDENNEVRLVPGIYKVSGTIFNKKELVIPAEKRCTGFDIIAWEHEECQDLDETKLGQFVSGGIALDTPQTYITITPEDLYTSNQITFYVISQDILSTPLIINSSDEKCAMVVIGYPALFYGCTDEKVKVSGRIMESFQPASAAGEISRKAGVRESLQPKFR